MFAKETIIYHNEFSFFTDVYLLSISILNHFSLCYYVTCYMLQSEDISSPFNMK